MHSTFANIEEDRRRDKKQKGEMLQISWKSGENGTTSNQRVSSTCTHFLLLTTRDGCSFAHFYIYFRDLTESLPSLLQRERVPSDLEEGTVAQ